MKSWKYFVIIYDTPSSACDIYTHYIQCGGTLLCIRSSLLCEPVSLRVVMRLVHATDKTWYTFLYHHTMYVLSLPSISIKTNFRQIARVELKCVQYSEGDYILCTTSRFFSVHSPTSGYCVFSSVNGHFRVETTELRRVHVHSSLLVVTSNQNGSNKKKIV